MSISNIPTVGIFGATNSGKSTLFNLLVNKEIAIVSQNDNTTTDPITTIFEMIGYGKVRLIDTAGFLDNSILAQARENKTISQLEKIDLALYLLNAQSTNLRKELARYHKFIKENNYIKTILLLNKTDQLTTFNKNIIKDENLFILNSDYKIKQQELYNLIKNNLKTINNNNLLNDISLTNKSLLLVIPLDSEAPQDRLILPQSRLISDAIKLNLNISVVSLNNLDSFLLQNKNPIDLVITDSKVFEEVDALIDKTIPLTSFSILFAREKGDLKKFYNDLKIINTLKNKPCSILIKEACKHSKNHEDIGTVVIPNLLKKIISEKANIFFDSNDGFNNLNKYDLVIHCGACMMSNTQMNNRIKYAIDNNIMITNYGLFLAYSKGILDRAVEIFKIKNNE